MKLFRSTIVILTTVLFFAGCISEDRSECVDCNGIVFNFDYLNFPQKITSVNIGFFDSQGVLVESRLVEKGGLNEFQGVKTGLEPGNYTAICWGNAFNKTRINGFGIDAKLENGTVTHPNMGTSLPITGNDSLFYGKLEFVIPDSREFTGNINFNTAYIRIKTCVQGLYSTSEGQPSANYPIIRINNLKPVYDFDRKTHGEPVSYFPQIVVNPSERKAMAQCDVFRFDQANDVTIDILDNAYNNTVLFTVNIETFLKENNITITDVNEVEIPILVTIDENGVDVTISVSKWEENIIIPEP